MKDQFCVKVHQTPYGLLVAICDLELIDKKLSYEGIEIIVSRDFYCESIVDIIRVRELMQRAVSLNLLGNNIVKLALSMGFIHEDAIIFLNDEKNEKIAHALVHLFAF
ncbi:MAG: DUF424 family protein [Crenarchaeota archaeon]|nr:DUF424 family protein [Thermoproteota archaeon]MCR8454299.1 DUF424 family protein [Thermoproteota archaeon]MCR8455067.1 DUF424 family protein [Thermoproteota archaeon]MCR8463360.1 DUF424 family protein [Thermoproteota archaeon]MCR8470807.1 DUF424 family protein [Thermoproteota archaeon]